MRGRLVRRGVATVAALALCATGAVGQAAPVAADADEASLLSTPGMAVSLAQAGELKFWGDNTYGQSTVPASLAGVAISQVVLPERMALVLTADGRVVGWGRHPRASLERVPAAVAAVKVAQIAARGDYAGAVTRDGRVLTWGAPRDVPTALDVPAGLSGVTQLALSQDAAAALKADGSVVGWGSPQDGQNKVPDGLKATAIAGLGSGFLALTDQGTVKTWGAISGTIPAPLQQPGNVKAIAAGNFGALALLADGTIVPFAIGLPDGYELPSEFTAPLLMASGESSRTFAIVDQDRTIQSVVPGGDWPPTTPSELNGRDLAQIVLANEAAVTPRTYSGAVIVTKMLRAELPQVTGAPTVGSVLTGVPGTFSAVPDSVTSQWLVDGAPVSGASAQLSVTSAMVGKQISYRSTATKAGEAPVTSTSAAVTVRNPAPVIVASKTQVSKVKAAKKAASVTVTGKVNASKSPAGVAKVTIVKGKKTIVAKNVKVAANGVLTLKVKKFNKLVAKKTKAKGKKAKTAYRGKYTVTISYAGNSQVKASKASKAFKIKR